MFDQVDRNSQLLAAFYLSLYMTARENIWPIRDRQSLQTPDLLTAFTDPACPLLA